MDAAIQERLRIAMDEQGLDGLIAYSKENVAYGIGYTIPSQALCVRDRQFALAVNRDGERDPAAHGQRGRGGLRSQRGPGAAPVRRVRRRPDGGPGGGLDELGLVDGKVGVEMDAMPADRWEALRRLLPKSDLGPAGHAFARARMVKTPAELDRLRQAAGIADRAQLGAHAHVREGMSEHELYRVIVDQALEHGADTVLLVQVAAGERSVLSNPVPSDRLLRRGEVVKIDTFVSVRDYLSDTGRAFVVGEATAEQRDIWRRMQETLAEIHEAIQPGVQAREVWETFVRAFERRGLEPAIRFLGHGLGLSLHEEPFIAAHSETVLEEGMVLAIEPIYRRGDSGFHLEDNLIVTATGVENMTAGIGPELVVAG